MHRPGDGGRGGADPRRRATQETHPSGVGSAVEKLRKVVAGGGEPLRVRGKSLRPYETSVTPGEDIDRFDDQAVTAVFDPAGNSDNFLAPSTACGVGLRVADKVDRACNGGNDERVTHVFTGKQGKCAHFRHGFPCTVSVD